MTNHDLSILSDSAMLCRDISHPWKPKTAKKIHGGYERVLRCPVCKTERLDHLTTWGAIRRRTYRYPEGYLLPRGSGALTPADRDKIRLSNIQDMT